MTNQDQSAAQEYSATADADTMAVRSIELDCPPTYVPQGGQRTVTITSVDTSLKLFDLQHHWRVAIDDMVQQGNSKACMEASVLSDCSLEVRLIASLGAALGDRVVRIYACAKGEDPKKCKCDGGHQRFKSSNKPIIVT
ncbi:MAG: hypothetical protein ACREEP_06125 [Dongiaceae bacterium]